MNLSKEDTFCEGQSTTTTATASTNVLDFHKHGDDILHKLFLCLQTITAAAKATLTVVWQTSDDEAFTSPTAIATYSLATANMTKGAMPIKNEPLPKGLKRYNRLQFTGVSTAGEGETSTYPKVSAFLIDGRDEGTPFKG